MVIVRMVTGARFRAHTCDYYGRLAAVTGFFAWKNIAVASAVCSPGDTIIDVGANVGTETSAYRDIVGPAGRVLAIEPLPSNQGALLDLVGLNGWQNVDVIPIALSDEVHEGRFMIPPQTNSGIGFIASEGQGESAAVRMSTLDAHIEAFGAATAIFSDTEGHEVQVLRGAREYLRRYRPVYTVEVVPEWLARARTSPTELFDELSELGYDIFLLTWRGLTRLKHAGDATEDWVCIDRMRPELAGKISRRLRSYAIVPIAVRARRGFVDQTS